MRENGKIAADKIIRLVANGLILLSAVTIIDGTIKAFENDKIEKLVDGYMKTEEYTQIIDAKIDEINSQDISSLLKEAEKININAKDYALELMKNDDNYSDMVKSDDYLDDGSMQLAIGLLLGVAGSGIKGVAELPEKSDDEASNQDGPTK